MIEARLPEGWDNDRVKRVIAHYEAKDEDAQTAEDELAQEPPTHAVMSVPFDLVPAVRELIAKQASH